MKNTLENKAKFFAQYWGQNILIYEPDLGYRRIVNDYKIGNADEFVALLKPLSQITDEDAIEVAKIITETVTQSNTGEEVEYFKEEILKDPEVLCYATSDTVDYCRSKGYAAKWNRIPVSQQVKWEWVELKTK